MSPPTKHQPLKNYHIPNLLLERNCEIIFECLLGVVGRDFANGLGTLGRFKNGLPLRVRRGLRRGLAGGLVGDWPGFGRNLSILGGWRVILGFQGVVQGLRFGRFVRVCR